MLESDDNDVTAVIIIIIIIIITIIIIIIMPIIITPITHNINGHDLLKRAFQAVEPEKNW